MDAAMVDSNLTPPWPPVEVALRSSDSESDFSNSDYLNSMEIVIKAEPQRLCDQSGDFIDDTSDAQLSAGERNCIEAASVAPERKTQEELSSEDVVQVWSLTQLYSASFYNQRSFFKSAFFTNTKSRFMSIVLDSVPVPSRFAQWF